jgi:AAA domain
MIKPQTYCADLTYLPEAIHPFTEEKRWTCWKWVPRANGSGEIVWTKPPYDPYGNFAKSNDPPTWCTFPQALGAYQTGKFDGIGYMLSETQIAAIDLDKCRNPETGGLDEWAADIINDAREEGAYIETTVSGTGIRIIGTSHGAATQRIWLINGSSRIELYRNTARYITISGLEIGACGELPELSIFDRLIVKYDSQKPNGTGNDNSDAFDFNDAPEQFGDIDDIIKNGVPKGKRSETFQYVISQLATQGLSIDEIERRLREYPAGIAAKYWPQQLRTEIERSFAKWQERQSKSQSEETNNSPPPFTRRIKRGGDFILEYEPIIYTIDGMLPSGCIYGVTAKRGTGKTAFLQGVSLSTVNGSKSILNLDVDPGRVAYIILENPTDFRMKLAVNAYIHRIDIDKLNSNLAILDARLPHSEVMAQLNYDAYENGPYRLVCYDTYQAGFSGAQFNDNNDMLRHAQALRGLTKLPGQPAALIACHPVKNATKDNLEPYGGGATMNEFDGNLTLWNENGRIELGWNKVRGPEFETRYFYIDKLGSPNILDSKGRTPLLPIMRPMSTEDADRCKENSADLDRRLLKAMLSNPEGTQADWANEIARSKGSVNDRLQKLKKLKLVDEGLGKWRLTPQGIKEAER